VVYDNEPITFTYNMLTVT